MTPPAQKLSKLKTRLSKLEAKVSRFEAFLNEARSDSSLVGQLGSRLGALTALWAEFDVIQSEIEELDTDSTESHDGVRARFENKYFELVAFADALAPPREVPMPVAATGVENKVVDQINMALTSRAGQLKLPQLNLPSFSGSYDQWTQFRDTFQALINGNDTLSKIQKFYYLQAALKGDANQVIQSLQLTEGNYDTAWTLLNERYDNKKAIIHSHLKGITELTSILKESHVQLRKFLDTFQRHFRSLQNLGEKVDQWDTILLFLLTAKLDNTTKREWEKHSKDSGVDAPTVNQFTQFLTQRCQFLESLEVDSDHRGDHTRNVTPNRGNVVNKQYSQGKTQAHVSNNHITCPICKDKHFIHACQQFLDMSPDIRYSHVKRLHLCTNCLRSGHVNADCHSGNCRKCSRRHNSLLHTQQNNQGANNSDRSTQQAVQLSHCNTNAKTIKTTVLLSTAVLSIYNQDGMPVSCRALLDNGSMSNFISERLYKQLRLKPKHISLPVQGINCSLTKINKSVTARISSINTDYHASLNFLVIREITDITPQRSIDISGLDIPRTIKLADPGFSEPGQVDILLGAGVFYDLLRIGQVKLGKDKPILHNTRLGWVVAGNVENPCHDTVACNLLTVGSETEFQLEDFWRLEELPQRCYSKQQQECEDHFVENVRRESDGKFCVKLPFKDSVSQLGDSVDHALQRFYSMERRLAKNPSLKTHYTDFMQEYESLGHMSRVPVHEISNQPHCYLAHHAVEKQSSITTKVRVVFDASAKTSTGLSLNDVLKVGPTIQGELFTTLIRFRQHTVALTADVTKMYRCISIDPSQRDMQRIVWRNNPDEPIVHYRLNTVTYGTGSASFLATRCLMQLAIDCESLHPVESDIIKSDFYMDDLLTGADDHESLTTIKNKLEEILSGGGFQLRKFMSTDPRVLTNRATNSDVSQYIIEGDQSSKTLGIFWNSVTDQFVFTSANLNSSQASATKRTILSSIAQVFDPLGLLQPIIIIAKLIIQKLWQLKLDWDTPVPDSVTELWRSFLFQLENISQINVPRNALLTNPASIQLHAFCDASASAYGVCIYLVSKNSDGEVRSRLLCSKSRVAPIKVVSIPRLELCGALVLSRLLSKVTNAVIHNIDKFYCWTDSTIVLSWLASEPSTWKVFVSNRVSEIQQRTSNAEWRHVPSTKNPADLLSRGTSILEFTTSQLWWHGPEFLTLDYESWPSQPAGNLSSDTVVAEQRARSASEVAACVSTFNSRGILEKFSSFSQLLRIIAYCLRFIHNSKVACEERRVGNLTIEEITAAQVCIVKMVQTESFGEDIHNLSKGKSIKHTSRLASLYPFVDELGLLRVGGRLRHAKLPHSQKHPILLPKRNHFTQLVIKDIHIKNLHAGIQATLSYIRQQFWPMGGKNEVKRVLHSCITCFRAQPRISTHRMGDLPAVRVTPGRVFASCGIDYAGPFPLKDGNTRSRKIIKSYFCIFVCLASKAVHLELVTSLTSECFLNALKRFVARRGLCNHIYSDNASNFTHANKILHSSFNDLTHDTRFNDYLMDSHIQWHFIPPRSPHFGGIWESAVKSVKSHLSRVTASANLNYEQFSTLLAQIESVLNSRPISPLSNDPNDLEVLTPGHFIIGGALNALSVTPIVDETATLNSKFKQIQLMVQHFWSRWKREYLHTLQQRTKWKFDKQPTQLVGAMVLLKDDNLPANRWSLGRITAVHPGSDGVVRVVSILTKSGVFRRAVAKVCVMPQEGNNSDF